MKQILQLVFFLLTYTTFSQQYVNGNLSTGTVSNSGVTAPAGYTWSELQSNVGEPSITNNQEGASVGNFFIYKFADDFIIPTGQIWNIQTLEFYVFKFVAVSSLPVNALKVEIWDGVPNATGSNKIYGDLTTNILDVANSGEAMMYSLLNTNFPTIPNVGEPAIPTKKIWRVRGNVNVTLNSGTYWLVFQMVPVNTTSDDTWVPLNRYVGTRGVPINSAGKFWNTSPGNSWINIFDGGYPVISQDLLQDYPFKINYTLTLNNSEVTNSFFKLYPNPTKNQFTIQTDATQSVLPQKAVLYDIRGLKVFETKINAIENNSFTIDISSLNKGIYFVKLLDSDKVIYTNKIIKE